MRDYLQTYYVFLFLEDLGRNSMILPVNEVSIRCPREKNTTETNSINPNSKFFCYLALKHISTEKLDKGKLLAT